MVKAELRKKVVFILAPGYSRSTLLMHFLGAHNKIMNIGELLHSLKNNPIGQCLHCYSEQCPVWQNVISAQDLSKSIKII